MRSLPALLQLASPTLPVGAYSYSQGLEWAVETGTVRDEASARNWIAAVLTRGMARMEGAVVAAAMDAASRGDAQELGRIDERFLRGRETSELLRETLQMGFSMRSVLRDLEPDAARLLEERQELSYPVAWAVLASTWEIPLEDAVTAYLWGWCEGQILAAVKAVPLGQAAGQRLFRAMHEPLVQAVQVAMEQGGKRRFTSWLPGLSLASTLHETQYTRLFRS
ncbi:MAG: hypothetical protein RL318_1550 [Fibrobacterota bacterium]|jgi:urease accessory protein